MTGTTYIERRARTHLSRVRGRLKRILAGRMDLPAGMLQRATETGVSWLPSWRRAGLLPLVMWLGCNSDVRELEEALRPQQGERANCGTPGPDDEERQDHRYALSALSTERSKDRHEAMRLMYQLYQAVDGSTTDSSTYPARFADQWSQLLEHALVFRFVPAAAFAGGGGAATPIATLATFTPEIVNGNRCLILGNLVVDEAHRGRGLARAMLQLMTAHADAKEHPIYLTHRANDEVLNHLYADFNFVELEEEIPPELQEAMNAQQVARKRGPSSEYDSYWADLYQVWNDTLTPHQGQDVPLRLLEDPYPPRRK